MAVFDKPDNQGHDCGANNTRSYEHACSLRRGQHLVAMMLTSFPQTHLPPLISPECMCACAVGGAVKFTLTIETEEPAFIAAKDGMPDYVFELSTCVCKQGA